MERRRFLAALPLATAGCLAAPPGGPADTDAPEETTKGSRYTPIERSADGVTATFEVTDVHAPTDEAVDATREGGDVVVTGTFSPYGCHHPVLAEMGRDGEALDLTVRAEATYGATATVECGAGSYDYRVRLVVESGSIGSITVVHDRAERDDRTYTVDL